MMEPVKSGDKTFNAKRNQMCGSLMALHLYGTILVP